MSFPDLEKLADAAKTGNPAAVVTHIDDDTPTQRWSVVQPDGSSTLHTESFTPPPRMLVFGAIDFAPAVVRVGRFLGYHVTVCDARPVFATPARFPEADETAISIAAQIIAADAAAAAHR